MFKMLRVLQPWWKRICTWLHVCNINHRNPQKGQFLRNRRCIQDTPVNSRRWWTYPYQSWCKSCKDLCGYRCDRWEAVLLSLVFRPSTFHTPCGCKSCSQSKRNMKNISNKFRFIKLVLRVICNIAITIVRKSEKSNGLRRNTRGIS